MFRFPVIFKDYEITLARNQLAQKKKKKSYKTLFAMPPKGFEGINEDFITFPPIQHILFQNSRNSRALYAICSKLKKTTKTTADVCFEL